MITDKQRIRIDKLAKEFKFQPSCFVELHLTTHPNRFAAMIDLFDNRVTSGFKLAMRKQLLEWLREDKHRFATPFTPMQLVSI